MTATVPQIVTQTIPVTLTLLAPLHHGAGTSGNTQLLRTQEITLADGTSTVVPFVSGNSVRHAIRAAAAEHLLRTIGAQPGTLPKTVVDLLYTGGALTGSGSNIDLDTHRRLDQMWPAVGLLGYAGRSHIWAGTLYVDHVHLVCHDNAWRLPAHLANHPHAQVPAAALRDEEFGTRHDIIGTAADRWLDTDVWTGDTNQMIFDWQVVRAGATMWTTLHLAAATLGHVTALAAAWGYLTAAGTMHLGAKRAQGYGLARVEADLTALPEVDLSAYEQSLAAHGDEILRLLAEVA